MPIAIDLAGQRFGRLVVVRLSDARTSGQRKWECRCDCGNLSTVLGNSLRRGLTRSCGCLKDETTRARLTRHGMRGTKIYVAWHGMLRRCLKPSHESYKNYGARGITVCERWKLFENFYADMGDRPEGMTLDRFPNNDGNYEPGNCRWATPEEQARNKRSNVVVTYGGRQMCLRELATLTGVDYDALHHRVSVAKWSIEKAVSTPIRGAVRAEAA